MRESAVIRIVNEELVWYPPGSSGEPRSLASEAERAQLQAIASARRASLVFAAPGVDVTLRTVSYTAAEKRHIASSLPYLLEEEFASDIENLHFASRPLGPLELGVAVCDHACMEHWAEQLFELPAISQWVPEPLLLPWRPGEVCVVLEAGSCIVRSGGNAGFSVERELSGPLLEALAGEAEFDTVIVYGSDQADMALLPARLRDVAQWRTGNFAEALMLAEEERRRLNLRQGAYGEKLPLERWWKQWRLVAGLFGIAFTLQLASTYADYSSLQAENLALRQQIEGAYRDAVPRGAIVDPEKQLKQQLEQLRGAGQGVSFVSLLERIGRVLQAQDGARIATVNFNDKLGDVRLNIVVPDFKAVELIRTRLDAAGLQADMENSNAQGGQVRARLKVREK